MLSILHARRANTRAHTIAYDFKVLPLKNNIFLSVRNVKHMHSGLGSKQRQGLQARDHMTGEVIEKFRK